jgi:RNA polymerase sigma factor (sigma-70 family)
MLASASKAAPQRPWAERRARSAAQVRQSSRQIDAAGIAPCDGSAEGLSSSSSSMALDPRSLSARGHPAPLDPEATLDLLERVRNGDDEALDALFSRCTPPLRRWAHGRLPPSARGMQDTADLVQDVVLSTFRRLKEFDARHQGALQYYLRRAVMNRIVDIIRQRDRRPAQTDMPEQLFYDGPSPVDIAISLEDWDQYEQALAQLSPSDQEAIVNRLELQYTYEELAVALDKPTANAARMDVMRAMKRLAEKMGHSRPKRD